MPTVPIPISKGVFRPQDSRSLRNSEFADELINMLVDRAGGNYDRPTLDLFATLASEKPIGMYYFKNVFVIVTNDRNIYTVSSAGTVVDITSVTLPGTARPSFADDGDTLVIAGGLAPLKWTGPGNTTALLGGSPPNLKQVVYLDGYFVGNVTDTNQIRFSDLDTPETWSASNLFTNNAGPDIVQGIAVSQRELYAIGEITTEVWQNIGTSPVPFTRAHVWQYGTRAPESIVSADNSVAFLNQDKRFMRFSGREFSFASEGIDEFISSYSIISDAYAKSFIWNGAVHALVVFPIAKKAWSVNYSDGSWAEWRGYDNDWSQLRLNCLHYSEHEGITLAGDFSSGKVWQFSDTVKTDAEGIFRRQRRLSYRDGGAGVRKRANYMRFNLKRNVAQSFTGTTSQTNPQMELRWRQDGKDWSPWRSVSLGVIGETKHYVEFYRLGLYRNRQYEFRMSDPAELNISSVETDEEILAR